MIHLSNFTFLVLGGDIDDERLGNGLTELLNLLGVVDDKGVKSSSIS